MTTIPTKTRSDFLTLEQDCREAVQLLRGQLIDLYGAMGLDPDQPQEVARRLRLNKNLTWKVSKIINAADGLSAIQHVPGAAGMEILLTCVETAGAPHHNIEGVRIALERFDEVVSRHAGDRPNLDLMLDSMGLGAAGLPLLASRELAFQGNSGLWGVQARTRVSTAFVAPDASNPESLNTVLLGGYIGFRRLRPTAGWPLFRFMGYHGDGTEAVEHEQEIDNARQQGDPPRLLRKFCTPSMPEIEVRKEGTAMTYLLPPGPVGNQGAFDCLFGDLRYGAPRYRTDAEDHGEFASSVTLPIETLVFDLIVHRSLDIPAPTASVYGRPMGGPDDPLKRTPETKLPLAERCVELAGSPPAVATPLVPRYSEMVHMVMARLGYPPDAFRGWRLVLPWPPMTSTAVLRWPLEERPR